jgi:hypothetical protein
MTDEVSEYGQKPVAVDLQRVKAEDVPGLMELVGAAASAAATVRVRIEADNSAHPSSELEPVPDPSHDAIAGIGDGSADREARERDQP